MDNKQHNDDLGQPGEIKQYDRHNLPENDNKGHKGEGTPIYFTTDSTLQTPEEHQHDQSVDPRKDNTMAASNDDLHQTIADRAAAAEPANSNDGSEEANA